MNDLIIPLDNNLRAIIPFPMDLEDFELLLATLELWKRVLVSKPSDQPQPTPTAP